MAFAGHTLISIDQVCPFSIMSAMEVHNALIRCNSWDVLGVRGTLFEHEIVITSDSHVLASGLFYYNGDLIKSLPITGKLRFLIFSGGLF